MEAFKAAADQGADGIELDVRWTTDEVLVVCHDAHLPDGRRVRATPHRQLPTTIPTLAEVLETGDWFVNIEIKNERDEPDFDPQHGPSAAVVDLVARFGVVDRVLVSSFDIGAVDRARALDPSIPAAWLVWGSIDPVSAIECTLAHGFQAIHPHDPMVDLAFVDRAHQLGLAVNVWTVDHPERLRELANMGVDGVISNDPGRARAALDSIHRGR